MLMNDAIQFPFVLRIVEQIFGLYKIKEARMDLGSVNWLAVVVCVVLAMVSGFVWYHPKLFFPAWWEGIGKSGEPGNPNPMIYVFTLLAAVVQAVAVALHGESYGEHNGCFRRAGWFHALAWIRCPHKFGEQTICRAWIQSLGD